VSIAPTIQPSHIEDSIYFVSSTAIVAGIMTWRLGRQLVVEDAPLVIAFAGFATVLLLASRPEKHLSDWFVKGLLMRKAHGQEIRLFVAYGTLYTRCWQSSAFPLDSINETAQGAITRVIRRPEAHDDITAVHSFTYFSLAIVPLLYTYGLGLWSWFFGVVFCVVVGALVALRNFDHPKRLRMLAKAWWLFDLISEDERRRKDVMLSLAGLDGRYEHQYAKDVASLSKLLEIASVGDWDGFCKNFGLFGEDFLRIAKSLSKQGAFDAYVQDLCAALTTEPGSEDHRERMMIAVNSTYLIKEAIVELAGWRDLPDATDFVPIPSRDMTIPDDIIEFSQIGSLIPLLNIARKSLSGNRSNPEWTIMGWELCKVLNKQSISTLSDNTMNALLGLPISIFRNSRKASPPSWDLCSRSFEHERAMLLACRLIQAVDSGIWSPLDVLPILRKWEVDIKPLAPYCSCTSLRALLSLPIDLPEDTIRSLIGPTISTCHQEAVDPILIAYKNAPSKSRTMIESEVQRVAFRPGCLQVAQEVLNRISELMKS